jgi:uncharacterized membrane protein
MRGSKLSGPSAAPVDGPDFFNLPSRQAGGRMKELFKIAVVAFEAIAVVVLIVGTVLYIGRFVMQVLQGTDRHEAYRDFREGLGRILLLAVDLLVAADIILTVALDLSFESLGMLGLLVLIRTFLHFLLELELTGRWPWQSSREQGIRSEP